MNTWQAFMFPETRRGMKAKRRARALDRWIVRFMRRLKEEEAWRAMDEAYWPLPDGYRPVRMIERERWEQQVDDSLHLPVVLSDRFDDGQVHACLPGVLRSEVVGGVTYQWGV